MTQNAFRLSHAGRMTLLAGSCLAIASAWPTLPIRW